MKKILITGSGGFVGSNLSKYILDSYEVRKYNFSNNIDSDTYAIIHLAGISHDLKNTKNESEYFSVNYGLTKEIFDKFLISKVNTFIFLSSVKAVADELYSELTEEYLPNPSTNYGRSKLKAEHYILSKFLPKNKRVYILRPCMIHGPNNKGNLNLLFKSIRSGIPWPLGAFENKRSFCSIENLCFVIKELIENEEIESGVYNISDNEPLSTNEIVSLISYSLSTSPKILHIPKFIIYIIVHDM